MCVQIRFCGFCSLINIFNKILITKSNFECELRFDQNLAGGSPRLNKIKECFAPCEKKTPHNTAHMRQHEKIEKLEAWNRDLPSFWRDFHKNRDILKNCILIDFDRFQHA